MTPAGRIYYVDHTNQTTTWEKPRYKEMKPTVVPTPATPTPVEQVQYGTKSIREDFHCFCVDTRDLL